MVERERDRERERERERKTANKEDDARSDIKCCGFWSNQRQAYFDGKVVSPFARSYVK